MAYDFLASTFHHTIAVPCLHAGRAGEMVQMQGSRNANHDKVAERLWNSTYHGPHALAMQVSPPEVKDRRIRRPAHGPHSVEPKRLHCTGYR